MTNSNGSVLEQRKLLYSLLGDLPNRQRPVSAKYISSEETSAYLVERLELDLNGLETIPALFVKPKNTNEPLPCILYNHAHGGNYQLGKEELLVGRNSLQTPPYAELLTSQGYSVLCIDTWCFGERQHKTESATFKEMLWKGQVLWGMMVFDSIKAIDYLFTRSDLDTTRIGTLGLSMGSTMAWWLAALDTRIKVCIDICCLTDFQELLNTNATDDHSIYYYVPSLLNHFTTAEINRLIAPRSHLSLAGSQDSLTPVSGLEKINKQLIEDYAKHDASEAWKLKVYDVGHQETTDMRQDIIDFLKLWL